MKWMRNVNIFMIKVSQLNSAVNQRQISTWEEFDWVLRHKEWKQMPSTAQLIKSPSQQIRTLE